MHQYQIVVQLLTIVALVGCGGDETVAPVSGIVRLDGKPLTTGTVRFVPDAGRAAKGQIQSDGTYSLGTYRQSDGAVIGHHKVAIIANEIVENGRPAYEIRGQGSKPLVPPRYMSVGTSQLTFDVKAGKNQADFDLTTSQ